MATRNIKDAVDLSSGSLIYFKGHAKATYISDGSTVEDAIENLNSKIESDCVKPEELNEYATKNFVTSQGYITKSEVPDPDFNSLQGNPFAEDDSGNFTMVDENGNIGFQLNQEGLVVKDVVSGDHILSNKADKLDIPVRISQLENDSEYITLNDIPSLDNYATVSQLSGKADLENGKIIVSQLPDYILGQVMFGGLIYSDETITASSNFISKYGNDTNISASEASKYNGVYFIVAGEIVNSTIVGVSHVSTGDWIISVGDSWAKIDNSDAVTSVAGLVGAIDASSLGRELSYNDLKDKPTIPTDVTESTVSGWGFTKNTGTYSKPNDGVPKSDLESSVQTSLEKADSALQSYTEQYTGTITEIKMNGASKGTSGVVDLGTVITEHQDISGKQDTLVSGTNIKTINGTSILGSGNITIEVEDGSSIYIWNCPDGVTSGSFTQEQFDAINNSDILCVRAQTAYYGICTRLIKRTSNITADLYVVSDAIIGFVSFVFTPTTWTMNESEIDFETKQDTLVSGTNIKTINGTSILGSGDITIETNKSLATVATTGSYEDLVDKPTIPDEVTDTTVTNWGFTKNVGTVTEIKMNGSSVGTEGSVDLGTVIVEHQDISHLATNTSVSLRNIAAVDSELSGDLVEPTIAEKQDKLISGTNIKTINGTSILGSGDITISSGDGSGVYAEVNHGTSDTTFTLTPNTFHVWDEVNELTLTLGDETTGVANEFVFQFTSGSEPTALTLPDNIKWVNDTAPNISENMVYQISVLKGMAVCLEFSNAMSLIRFYVNMSGDWRVLECASNMTWSDYVNSEYNTNSQYTLAIDGDKITYGMFVITDQMPSDVIIDQQYYDMYLND